MSQQQSQLPPYSTFRTDSKQLPYPQAQSNGNILAFTPPGFKQTLWIKFPDSRLAVCRKCKKNFKTRELCRVRNRHSAAPWTTAYICVTIDDSCLDEEGRFVEEEMTVRMIQWQPYCVKKVFEAKTPVCACCKKTNRTRSFCRERHKHRLLPWNTVYVLLSTLKSVDPSTVVAKAEDAYSPNYGPDEASTKSDTSKGDASADKSDKSSPESNASKPARKSGRREANDADTISSDNEDNGDDIFEVPESKTFLAMVSSRATSIHWLELGEVFPDAKHGKAEDFNPSGFAASMEPMPFFNANVGYPAQHLQYAQQAQQHQNALKLRQQQQFLQMQQQLNAGQPKWQPWPSQHFYPGNQGEPVTAGDAAAAQQQQQQVMEDGIGTLASPFPFYNPAPGLQQYPFSGGSENLPVNGGQHSNFQSFTLDPEEPSTKRQRNE